MDESKFDEEMALNRAAFEQLRSQIRRDYTGQYVAIAFGRIIAVSPNFDEAVAAVNLSRSEDVVVDAPISEIERGGDTERAGPAGSKPEGDRHVYLVSLLRKSCHGIPYSSVGL